MEVFLAVFLDDDSTDVYTTQLPNLDLDAN